MKCIYAASLLLVGRITFQETKPPEAPSLLRKLHGLDKASPESCEQLINFLHGDEYQKILPELQSEDLAWLVEYLDNVSL